MTAEALDGNAAAGILFTAYGREMTPVMATCMSCGNIGPLAEAVAYLHAPGAVLRCRSCGVVLLVVLPRPDATVSHEVHVQLATEAPALTHTV